MAYKIVAIVPGCKSIAATFWRSGLINSSFIVMSSVHQKLFRLSIFLLHPSALPTQNVHVPKGEKTRLLHAASVAQKIEKFFAAYSKHRVVKRALEVSGLLRRTLFTQIKYDPSLRTRFETLQNEIENSIQCSVCKKIKNRDQFHNFIGKRKFLWCKPCRSALNRQRWDTLEGRLKYLASAIKCRDSSSDITYEVLLEMWNRQSGLCHYTKKPMEIVSGPKKNWDLLSIDKQTPGLGYKKGNCVLCSVAANAAKNNRTETEFIDFCRLVVATADHYAR